MKTVLLTSALFLISLSSYSQDDYLKQLLLNGLLGKTERYIVAEVPSYSYIQKSYYSDSSGTVDIKTNTYNVSFHILNNNVVRTELSFQDEGSVSKMIHFLNNFLLSERSGTWYRENYHVVMALFKKEVVFIYNYKQ